jgi:hypothetical protein
MQGTMVSQRIRCLRIRCPAEFQSNYVKKSKPGNPKQ